MDSTIQAWLFNACTEGREWLSEYLDNNPDATAADVWNNAPHGGWVVWGATMSPGSRRAELAPRACAVAAAFALAVLPAVPEEERAVCEHAIELAERAAQGDRVSSAVAEAASWAARSLATAAATAAADAADAAKGDATEAAHMAAGAAVVAAEDYADAGFTLPTADEVRALLGPATDWLK